MHIRTLFATLLFGFLAAAPALAGPPLLCHPNSIGSAHSLPWSTGPSWRDMAPSYNVANLVSDTLALLTPQTPTVVREETLRRAAVYSSKQSGLAGRLSARLLARTQSAPNDPTAWFDAGYFVETAREATIVFPSLAGELPHIDGLAFVRKAIRLGGKNMERAESLVASAQPGR